MKTEMPFLFKFQQDSIPFKINIHMTQKCSFSLSSDLKTLCIYTLKYTSYVSRDWQVLASFYAFMFHCNNAMLCNRMLSL